MQSQQNTCETYSDNIKHRTNLLVIEKSTLKVYSKSRKSVQHFIFKTVFHRMTSYRRWNDVVCLQGYRKDNKIASLEQIFCALLFRNLGTISAEYFNILIIKMLIKAAAYIKRRALNTIKHVIFLVKPLFQ